MSRYKFDVKDCDIEDKETLERFREKHSEWRHLMSDDDHAVSKQLHSLLWSFNVYLWINENRRIEHESGGNSASLNRVIAEFIDNGFVLTISSNIRKLWEKSGTNREKQIISLRRVIEEVKDNSWLFTRENYVCFDGLPYDYEAVQANWEKNNLGQGNISGKVFWRETTGPNASGTSCIWHKQFDTISLQNTNTNIRSRTDKINPDIFNRLIAHIDDSGFDEIKTLANKLFFHAGDQISRDLASAAASVLTINRLKKCIKAIYEVAAFLGSTILNESHPGGFPAAQFNLSEKLEYPWCNQSNLDALDIVWRKFENEVLNWDASERFKMSDRR